MRTRTGLSAILTCTLAIGAGLIACGSDEPNSAATPPGSDGGGSSGANGGIGNGSSGNGSSGGAECVAHEAEASLERKPIDIVFLLDNSSSMEEETRAIEAQINENFASVIGQSDVDYRVIMLSLHGHRQYYGDGICVSAPLSGTNCAPVPPLPAETARFFQHNVLTMEDMLQSLFRYYAQPDLDGRHPGGYSEMLRENAFKVFVQFSDDKSTWSIADGAPHADTSTAFGEANAAAFDRKLMALSPRHFGRVGARNYRWHSILGMAAYDRGQPNLAHQPDAPIVSELCDSNQLSPGYTYQSLSKLTGGLRYPLCGHNYSAIFRTIAEGVIASARIDCSFPLPLSADGAPIDRSTLVGQFAPTAGPVQSFYQVGDPSLCADNRFYVADDRVELCPSTCDAVNAESGRFTLAYGCPVVPH